MLQENASSLNGKLSAGNWHAAEVADNKDGTYDISIKPQAAGSFQLVLSMEGLPNASAHKRTYSGMCVADVAATEKCAISGVMTQLVAGQPGTLILIRADRCACRLLLPCKAPSCKCQLYLARMSEQTASPDSCLLFFSGWPALAGLYCTKLCRILCDTSRSVEASVTQVWQPCVEQQGAGAICADILGTQFPEAHPQGGRQRHCRVGDLRHCSWRLQPFREVISSAHDLPNLKMFNRQI